MILNGQDFPTSFKLRDVYQARDLGCDLGDLTNGKLQAVAVDLLAAIDAAYLVYKKRLVKIGITSHDELIECNPGELHELATKFRDQLEIFFPILAAIRAELTKAIQQAIDRASGPTYGDASESYDTNLGNIPTAS